MVLPALERHREVLAPTLPGHAGGPKLEPQSTIDSMLDAIEEAVDDAGFGTVHVAGNSLGGYLALKLAERGRAKSVVALAPAGGWASDDPAIERTHNFFSTMHSMLRAAAPQAAAILSTAEGRRRATLFTAVNFEHIPAELLEHQMVGAAACDVQPLIAQARREGWQLDGARITCPVRIVWGTEDRLLEWPSAAVRYREEWLPNADWVELQDVGHSPQLDVPSEAAELIAGFGARPR